MKKAEVRPLIEILEVMSNTLLSLKKDLLESVAENETRYNSLSDAEKKRDEEAYKEAQAWLNSVAEFSGAVVGVIASTESDDFAAFISYVFVMLTSGREEAMRMINSLAVSEEVRKMINNGMLSSVPGTIN